MSPQPWLINNGQIVGIAWQRGRQIQVDFRGGCLSLITSSKKVARLKIFQLRYLLLGQRRLHLRKRFDKNHCQLGLCAGGLIGELARLLLIKFPADDLAQQRGARGTNFLLQRLDLVALGIHVPQQGQPLLICQQPPQYGKKPGFQAYWTIWLGEGFCRKKCYNDGKQKRFKGIHSTFSDGKIAPPVTNS